jgi:MraZ protein
MSNPLGEYEVTLDPKGRFMIPAAFKRQIPEGQGERFILCRGFEDCITVYTEQQWEKVSGIVNRLNDFNEKSRTLKRLFLNGANMLELDSAGRILIPKTLIEAAQLKKELVFSAQITKAEIWDTVTFRERMKQDSLNMKNLASEVLGNEFLNPFEGL